MPLPISATVPLSASLYHDNAALFLLVPQILLQCLAQILGCGVNVDWCYACRYSDALLSNLWRWLCSPAAKLASSGLHRTVTGLLRKTLAQLVADLK